MENSISGSVGASLQVGAQAALNEYTTGICVLFLCTGLSLKLQQNVYVGFDVLAGAAAGDTDCVDGTNQLSTTFTDWDYSPSTKERFTLQKGGSFLFGGYMQMPRLAISMVMTTSLGTEGPDYDKPWQDFEMEKALYGDGAVENTFLMPLFEPMCDGSGIKLSSYASSNLGAEVKDTCVPTKMTINDVTLLIDTAMTGTFGEYDLIAPNPPPPSPPPSPWEVVQAQMQKEAFEAYQEAQVEAQKAKSKAMKKKAKRNLAE